MNMSGVSKTHGASLGWCSTTFDNVALVSKQSDFFFWLYTAEEIREKVLDLFMTLKSESKVGFDDVLTFWSTIEHTKSLTADSERSVASRFTVSLVSPICSRKDTPWKELRELVGLGALGLPLDSRW